MHGYRKGKNAHVCKNPLDVTPPNPSDSEAGGRSMPFPKSRWLQPLISTTFSVLSSHVLGCASFYGWVFSSMLYPTLTVRSWTQALRDARYVAQEGVRSLWLTLFLENPNPKEVVVQFTTPVAIAAAHTRRLRWCRAFDYQPRLQYRDASLYESSSLFFCRMYTEISHSPSLHLSIISLSLGLSLFAPPH